MKRILFVLLGLVALMGQAQAQGFDLAADTSNANRPRAGRSRVSAVSGRLYIKGATGNAIGAATLPELLTVSTVANGALPFAGTLSALQANTAPTVRYNNYDYKRKAGTVTTDNVLYVSAGAGFYYEIQLPYKRITPDMFGAIPNDGLDDGPALELFFNVSGKWQHYIPDGDYHSARALPRTNKGAVNILFASGARILFTADTDGLSVVNPLNGNYGRVTITNPTIVSAGTKTGRTALLVTTQHEQRPGPLIENPTIQGLTLGQEWSKALYLFDCSGTAVTNANIFGASLSVTTGITIANTSGRPSVEHKIYNPSVQTVKRGLDIVGSGSPAVEGVKMFGADFAGNFGAVFMVSPGYQAPDISFTNCHFNVEGGEAIHLENAADATFTKVNAYIYPGLNGVIPANGVYLKNSIGARGEITVFAATDITYCMYLDGTGGLNYVDLKAKLTSNATTVAGVVAGQVLKSTIERTWTGTTNAAWRSGNGGYSVGAVVNAADIPYTEYNKPNLSLMRLEDFQFKATSAVLGTALNPAVAGVGSTTVDPSLTGVVLVYNGTSTANIVIDHTKVPATGMPMLWVVRGDNGQTGPLFVQSSDPVNHFIQDFSATNQTSVSVPNVNGQKGALFALSSTHYRLLTGGGIDTPVTPTPSPAVVISANRTFSEADRGRTFVIGTNTSLNLTVPAGLSADWFCYINSNNSTGTHSILNSGTSVNGGTGSTSNNGIKNKITGSFQEATLRQTAANWYSFSGNVSL